MNLLPHYVIALLLTSVTFATMGIFVLLKNSRSLVNRTFFLHFISIATWSLFEGLGIVVPDKDLALLLWRVNHIGVIFIPIFLIHFIFSLLDINRGKRKVLFIIYSIGLIFLILDSTDLFISDVTPKFSFRYFIEPGIIYPVFFFSWIFAALYGHYKLFRAYSSASGTKRNQLKYHFWGLMIAYVGGTPNFLPTFYIEIYPINPFGTYGIIIYAIILTYAIVKHRLMDISLVFRGGLVFLSYMAIVSPIMVILFLLRSSFTSIVAVFIITTAFGPFLYQYVRDRSLSVIDSLLFKGKYKYINTLEKHIEKMILITDEKNLLKDTVNILEQTMNIEKAAILIRDHITGDYIIKYKINLAEITEVKVSQDSRLISWFRKNRGVFVSEEEEKRLLSNEMNFIRKELEPLQAKVCIPARLDSDLIGIITLGNKTTGEMYTHIDLELLERLGVQLAVALDYKRVESQLRKEQELASIGIMSMEIGHELRNLLQLPQTYIDLSLEKRNDNDFYRDFRNMAMDRMKVIRDKLNDIMYLGKERPLDLAADVEINNLLDENLTANDFSIKKENIEIVKEYAKVPLISADKSQLTHLFNNLILNAIDAMKNIGGKLRIRTAVNSNNVTKEMKDKASEWVRIEVKDDGTGIPEHVMKRLFTPFVTTKSLGRIEKSGTGLGLSVIKKVVDAHKGYIHVHTKEGKGTTFVVDLPIALRASYAPVPLESAGEPWEYKE